MELLQLRQTHSNAIIVRQGCRKYGATRVLHNLNMTVKKGSIYGLLGASGCGKTTLLSCVVGRRRLDSGEIRVLGVKPGTRGGEVPGRKVGYMPQETALYLNFTVRETMKYYGWIFGMSSNEIEDRLKELMNLTGMVDADCLVKNMSGGQQRRVSFVVALLHDADVLILDEPTAGMDALLKDIIWGHLAEITSARKVTIVLTTHYIEEARKAHTIGLMRDGVLLEEDSPDALLRKYGGETLEGVFLQLSARQQESENRTAVMVQEMFDQNGRQCQSLPSANSLGHEDSGTIDYKRSRVIFSTGKMKALLFKNIICVFRDLACMSYQFGLCILAVTCVYVGFGFDPTHLHLAVVNEDRSASDPRCSHNDDDGLAARNGCDLQDLGCRYLAHITEPLIVKEFYNSTEMAVEAVRLGRAWGTLHLGENFSEALAGRMSSQPLIAAGSEQVSQGCVHVRLDMSNQVIGWTIWEELRMKYVEFARNLLSSCGYNAKFSNVPLRINEPIYGRRQPSFVSFSAPAILNVMMFFFGVALTVWTITGERCEGLLNRNIVAGVTTVEIMSSYFLALSLLMCCQVALLVGFGVFVYRFECVGSLALVVAIVLLQGVNGMFLGFVISACCEKDDTAAYISVGSLIPMLLFCGVIWPLEGMHATLRYVSKMAPLTLPIAGIRAVMSRGSTVRDSEVYVALLASVAWMAILAVICTAALRINKL